MYQTPANCDAHDWHVSAALSRPVLRLDLEYEEGKKRHDRARYEAHSWQDSWHAFTRGLAAFWQGLGSCFLFGPVKAHLRKEAVCPKADVPKLMSQSWVTAQTCIYHQS